MSDVTLILQAVSRGEKQASEELLPLVYEELRRLAASRMSMESSGHTLQATALVHEAWLRLVGENKQDWQCRAQFFCAATEAMRRILIEHARRKSRIKHGGGLEKLPLDDLDLAQAGVEDNVLLINEAVELLEAAHPERGRIVVMKFFGGLSHQEIAGILGISERTVIRHWLCARSWLFREMEKSRGGIEKIGSAGRPGSA
jgi:RNA polymerase sigma factor (TIGR02999 family)